MDESEFKGSTFQRVYQYLRRRDQNKNLDLFTFQGNVEGTMSDCLKLFLGYIFVSVLIHNMHV